MRLGLRRIALLLGGVLFTGALALGRPDAVRAAGGSDDPPATGEAANITPEEAEENPDLPGFLDGHIDMEEYLRLRSEATSEYRGLPYSPGKKGVVNPRALAVQKLELQQKLQLEALTPGGLPPASWESVGPAPIPNGQTTTRSDPVSGRATAIAVHPTNPNKVYVGTAQGGVYRSLDGGATWTAIFDSAQSLAVGALALAPSNPNILYVGTGEANLSGDSFIGVGLYRIDNAETTANLTGPINPAVATGLAGTTAFTGRAISKILVHPTNPDIVFAATSTGMAGVGGAAIEAPAAVPPLAVLGLYRSMNATTPSPSFQKLVVTNVAGARLLAADARTENSRVVDMVFDPSNPNILVAAVYGGPAQGGVPNEGGIWRSTNALSTPAYPTFAKATAITGNLNTLNNAVRVSLATNKVGATVTVVAATGESASFAGSSCISGVGSGAIRKSIDGGATWSARLAGGAGFCGGQCSYDLPIEIDPTDANLIHIGGSANGTCSRTYTRSTDGGATFVQTDDGLHADAHAIVAAPSNPAIVYEANDGGIWKSTDAGLTWTSLNNDGFNATQFQSLALHPVDREFMIGGTQDNGTEWKRADGSWTRADFGDGGFALIDQSATDTENVTMYHTYFNQTNAMGYGRVTKASDAYENNWAFFGCGFGTGTLNGLNCAPAATSILFYAPMALGPGTPNTVYFGSDRLFRSSDQGASMVLASQGPIQSGVAVSAIGISPQNDNVRLVGMRFGRVYATATGASILTDVTGPWPVSANLAAQPRRFVARAVIDPNNSNVAYVTFATYCAANGTPTPNCAQVYKTSNLVSALLAATTPTWTAASSGIPDVPVNAFVVDPRNSSNLFAGTDVGVYNSTDGGVTWSPYGTGLPRVAVFDMALHGPSGTLRAATHGRGIWEIASGNAAPSFSGLASPTIGLGGSPTLLFGSLAAGSLIPPGSVDITVGGVTQSSAVDPATGFFSSSFDTSALAAGAYPIAYAFAGAPGYNGATGNGTLTVDAALTPTTTTLDAPTVPFPDAAVTVTVTSPLGTPTGNVTLQVDVGAVLTLALSGGSATFALPTLEAGTHSLLATYGANPPFGSSAAAGSLTVIKAGATVTVGSPRIAVGQTPTVIAGTVLAASAVPTGSVDISLAGVTQSAVVDPVTGAFSSTFATGALGAGLYPIGVSYAGDANFNPASATGTVVVTTATITTFSNPAAITINDVAPGSPYPSVINVSGLFGKVLKATVTLKGVSHTFFSDTAFLLVGPDGQTTALLYHAGPQVTAIAAASSIDITLDDSGIAFPTGTAPATGTFRPTQSVTATDMQTGGSPGPNPPPAPYGTVLFVHNGANPNGAWRLYVEDDFAGDVGSVAAGWELALTTAVEPSVSIGDAAAVVEGGDAVFTVTLSSPPAFPVDVDYTTASGTATSGADFAATSGTVSFGAFETSKTITVSTVDDIEDEAASESFFVNLSNPQNATIGDAQGQGTILDNDPFASIDDVRKPEGNSGTTSFTFTVRLTAPAFSTMSVRYTTVSLGATPGTDYKPVSGILAFAPGEDSRTITVPVVGDRLEEQDEFFKVVLSSPSGLTLTRSEGLGSIVNDDFVGLPKLSISDASLVEGNAGTSNMVFTVSLSRVSSSVVVVRYATANGTATAGTDYTATTGVLTFPVGTTQQTLSVPVIGDAVAEPNKTFFVNLSQPRGAALLDKQGKGTIVNDDP